MNNQVDLLIIKKLIKKELLNELYNKGLIDLINTSKIIKKLEEEINRLKNIQEKDINIKNLVVKIPI